MGVDKQSKKVKRATLSAKPRYGGDPYVDRHGVSTENHLQLWRRLVANGPVMHGPPGPPRPHKS